MKHKIKPTYHLAWRWLVNANTQDKAIGCRRPQNPEYLGKRLGKFIEFLRDIVLAPKAPMMHELALMTSSTLSNLGH